MTDILKLCDEIQSMMMDETEYEDLAEMLLTVAPVLIAAARREAKLREALTEIASGNRTTHEAINWAREALKD